MMWHNLRLLSVLVLTVSVLAASDFADTCTILSLSQGSGGGATGRASTTIILNARCEDSAGVLRGTTIDLNRCFGNINGQITCGS
ncbi:hypothetical protein EXIGLDRAFT_770607 [Exidia glandulosa HHB12029]|uniref:Cyanovirin-N domain-containing protein n=1 Tax=Exidia glandulosa HHB12029 TaxID=1314781 RepID=A0A166ACJ7_EXIGL|nr:hypothetical protein EXIGLDRAFT_770607 [Exidia glandulosa HHB12029]